MEKIWGFIKKVWDLAMRISVVLVALAGLNDLSGEILGDDFDGGGKAMIALSYACYAYYYFTKVTKWNPEE